MTGLYIPAHHEATNNLADEITQTGKLATLAANVIFPPQAGEVESKQDEADEQENKPVEPWKEKLPWSQKKKKRLHVTVRVLVFFSVMALIDRCII